MSKSKIVTLDSLSLSNILNEDSELIPLMTPEDEEIINKEDIPEILSYTYHSEILYYFQE